MALTCPNGHINDEGNRFCEQCGAPLQQPQADAAQPVAQATASPSATSSTCAVCGQENVPGTAFCDNCGAALPPPMPASEDPAASAPADQAPTSAPSVTSGGSTIACAQCGTENDASNRFCDNCGAKLGDGDTAAQPDAGQPEAVTGSAQPEAETASAQPEAETATAQPEIAAEQPDSSAQIVDTPGLNDDQSAAPVVEAAAAPTAEAEPAAIDPTLTAPEAPPASATTDTSADRQRLEEEIRTQQQVVSQLEQMQASFGAATPAAVVQGLEEARKKLSQAEADLQALPAAQPAADPAEVARLEEEIRTQQQVVSQLEQMQASFGAATPAAVVQGLEEARKKLSQAEADLQSLTGSTAPAAAPSTEAASGQPSQPETPPAAPSQAAEPAQPAAPAMPSQPAVTAAPVSIPATGGTNQLPPTPAQPQVSGARFVARDGSALSLPRTGAEIVIGRDDPISGIHPDVDLTPHGGEAGGVSRRHAVLRESNGQWLLTDLDSTNYTRIDGNRISPDTPTPLQDGARVQFGRLEFDFHAS